jgi:hypothetical protein
VRSRVLNHAAQNIASRRRVSVLKMNRNLENPNSNKLPKGISEEALLDAVLSSGYPLQTEIAEMLRVDFWVEEEWVYLDSDSKDLRNIDIAARKHLFHIEDGEDHPRVRPQIDLLIECKQTDLPYIFFLSNTRPGLLDFPIIAGLNESEISISTDDDLSTWTYPVIHALNLHNHPFVEAQKISYTFSKAVRKGKSIQLTGSDAYSSLILPLLKSVRHFIDVEMPPSTAHYFDLHALFAVAVVDGPILAVDKGSATEELVFEPWIRVLRHEYQEDQIKWRRSAIRVVDVVHKGALGNYLSMHLMPFAEELAERALRHHVELAEGKAFVSGMVSNWWVNIEERMKPTTKRSWITRVGNLVKRVARSLRM